MNESRFKCSVVNLLRKELPGAWIYHPSDRWISGIPDLLILWRGTFSAIELKVGKNKPEPLQLVTLAKIKTAGASVSAVCWTLEEVQNLVDKIKQEGQ